jgi:KDO2-lipid IV(A) lauroyltransferase
MVDLQQVINSSVSLSLVAAFARGLAPRWGYPVAAFIAEQIARQRNSRVVRAVRANQWVVSGKELSGEALDQVVRETFHHWAHSIFDLYHYIQDPLAADQLIVLEPSFQQLTRRPEFDRRGLMIVGLHLSNFDLVLQWLCKQGLNPLMLTIPNPQGGRQLEYEMRQRAGMRLLPASLSAFRQAIKHLQRGGMVATGIDRPIPNPQVCPRFFNLAAALPMHHIFLATKAHVPVVIAAATRRQDEKYHVFASDFLEMDSHPDPQVEMLRNAEKILSRAEEFIRRAPRQWSVPLPVWPEVMDKVPD